MSAPALDLAALAQPVSAEQPCGVDLAYDPQFVALERAAAGKPEQQFGDKVYPAEPPDWQSVHELALALAARTRDLRVAVWLLRSRTRLFALADAAQGLQLLTGWARDFWADLHPQLDASDGLDATMRVNALAALSDPLAALADLRAAPLAAVRGSLRVRDIELALGADKAFPGEAEPTEAGVIEALTHFIAERPHVADDIRSIHEAALGLAECMAAKLPPAQQPDLTALTKLTGTLAMAVAKVHGEAPLSSSGGGEPAAAAQLSGRPAAQGGAIASRADAARALELVCAWLEQNEPAHPAPLLIHRARRLLDKTFIDIVRDLIPDGGLNQIERIAGPEVQST